MNPRIGVVGVGIGVLALAACGGPPAPRVASGHGTEDANPLGPSYVLLSLPSDDDSLLGRILPGAIEPGHSLEETARANPCEDKLNEPRTSAVASSFEDAQDLQIEGQARAMLGAFGFSGDASRATHFAYRLEASKRISRPETGEYAACCREKGCGYGYVSALVYGEGEYATGEETTGNASVDVLTIGGASGGARLHVLHRRKVRGWLAAMITVTDPSKGQALGPMGIAEAAGITEASVPETVKGIYDREKIAIETEGGRYVFTSAAAGTMKENEFVRRYRSVTGSDELDPYDVRRNKASTYASGALTLISAGVAVFGVSNLSRPCNATDVRTSVSLDCQADAAGGAAVFGVDDTFDPSKTRSNGLGITMALAGGIGTVGFGTWFIVSLLDRDGSKSDHDLDERDATLYVTRYNRALLRRTIRDVQRTQSRSLRLEPRIGVGFTGLRGHF